MDFYVRITTYQATSDALNCLCRYVSDAGFAAALMCKNTYYTRTVNVLTPYECNELRSEIPTREQYTRAICSASQFLLAAILDDFLSKPGIEKSLERP